MVTTRRILERVTVHYVSRRMAWKLLKGASFLLLPIFLRKHDKENKHSKKHIL